jgi:hypothetical protein
LQTTASPALPRATSPAPGPRLLDSVEDGETTPDRLVHFMMNGPVASGSTQPPRKHSNRGDEDNNPPPVPRHNPPSFRG